MQSEGFALEGDQVEALRRLLQYLPDGIPYHKLEAFLTPICCPTPATHKLFHSILPELVHYLGLEKSEIPTQPLPKYFPTPRFYRTSGWLIALLLSAIGFLLLELAMPTIKGCMDPSAINYNPRASIPSADCDYPFVPPLMVGCMDEDALNVNRQANISCLDCCQNQDCTDPGAINYNRVASESCPNCCQYISNRLPSALQIAGKRDVTQIVLSNNTSPLKLPELEPIQKKPFWLLYFQKKRIAVIAFALFIGLLLTLWLYQRAWIDFLKNKSVNPNWPYYRPIPQHKDKKFSKLPPIQGSLKGKNTQIYHSFKQTIRTARNRSFVFLIDQRGENDHHAWYFYQVYKQYLELGLMASCYFYEDKPLFCWQPYDKLNLVPLEEIIHKHNDAQLVIFSDGKSWVDHFRPELEYWADRFTVWKNRVWMTPIPLEAWGQQEYLIAQLFKIIPPTNWGYEALLKPAQEFKLDQNWINSIQPKLVSVVPHITKENAKSVLAKYFPHKIRKWIAACAVYETVHPSLTYELGKHFIGDRDVKISDWHLILQLPWLKVGIIPMDIRQQLIGLLSRSELRKTHAIIDHFLDIDAEKGSTADFAESETTLQTQTHQLLAHPGKAVTRSTMIPRIHYWQFLGLRPDQINQETLAQQTPYHRNQPFRLMPDRSLSNIFIFSILAFVVALFMMLWKAPFRGKLASFNGNLYHVANANDHIDLLTYQDVQKAIDGTFISNDSIGLKVNNDLLSSFTTRRYLDSVYYKNLLSAHFNTAIEEASAGNYTNALFRLRLPLFREIDNTPLKANEAISNLDYWHLKGTSHYYLNQPDSAKYYSDLIERIDSSYWSMKLPNLKTLMTFEFVDTISLRRIRTRQNRKYTFITQDGTTPPNRYDFAYPYQTSAPIDLSFIRKDTIALVYQSGQYAFIDKEGKLIKDTEFRRLAPYECGNGLWGYSSEKNDPVIACHFEQAWPFQPDQELAMVMLDGKIGYVKRNGIISVTPTYDAGDDFQEGRANVRLNNKWGYIDATGKVVIPFRFDSAEPFNKGIAVVEIDNNRFEIDQQGRCQSGNNCPVASFILVFKDRRTQQPITDVVITHPIYGNLTANSQGEVQIDLLEHLLPRDATFTVTATGYVSEQIGLRLAVDRSIPTIYLDRVVQ